jgi:uncharacterized protein
MKYRITDKESQLNSQLRTLVTGKAAQLLELLIADEEVRTMHEYANHLSIKRLGFNDHGAVHMRIVARNALTIAQLLRTQGVSLSLSREAIGDEDDENCALLLAGFLHDLGMTLTRQIHEQTVLPLVMPIVTRHLDHIYGSSSMKYVVRSLALEAMLGHMATIAIHSYEAGIILVADGSDMECGRAELVMAYAKQEGVNLGHIGSVHQHSAHAIEKVYIEAGKQRKVAITILMNNPTGYFQVEETLLGKMSKSPIKDLVEVVVQSPGQDPVMYLI